MVDSTRSDRESRSIRLGPFAWVIGLIAVGGFGVWTGFDMEIRQAHDPLGGRFFPIAASMILVVSAAAALVGELIVVVRSWSGHGGTEALDGRAVEPPNTGAEAVPAELDSGSWRYAAGVIVVCAGYVAVLDIIGYLVATPIAMAGILAFFGRRGLKALTLGPVFTTVIVYLLFTQVFSVRLP